MEDSAPEVPTVAAAARPQLITFFNTNVIPGTGPYMVAPNGVSPNEAYVKFVKNPNYWGDSLTPAQIAANEYLDPATSKTL